MEYLIDGEIHEQVVNQYDSTVGGFISELLIGKLYKFYLRYEDAIANTNPNIIPVLLVTIPDFYEQGQILVGGTFTSLKSLIANDKIINPLKYFVVPYLGDIIGNSAPHSILQYFIKVDYNINYDPYGYFVDEICGIIMGMYYKEKMGDYYSMNISDGRQFNFVPTRLQSISSKNAILGRALFHMDIRACSFA